MVLNPFRPGAGQPPPYLAGRDRETDKFRQLLGQNPVSRNLILSGLRGVGKTVLLDSLKPIARELKWLWAGNDLSESASLTEDRFATRVLTDLAALMTPLVGFDVEQVQMGFTGPPVRRRQALSFNDLRAAYDDAPGLASDKLKAVISLSRDLLRGGGVGGIVFSYDEAQNLTDRAADQQYSLSLLLDVFASLQRTPHEVPIILVLAGLPTLFAKLNESRTYSERMFDVLTLSQLSWADARLAITKPIELNNSTLRFAPLAIDQIIEMSGGYPYFLQYICKESFDAWLNQPAAGEIPSVDRDAILAKMDQDFFAPRWERATARQQDFMRVIAALDTGDSEFSTNEIVAEAKEILMRGFSPSHATQLITALTKMGLIHRHGHGRYSFAVPLMADFIRRLPDPGA